MRIALPPIQQDDPREPRFLAEALARDWSCFNTPPANEMLVTATRRTFEIARLLVHNEAKRGVIAPFIPFLEAVFEDLLKLEHDCLLDQIAGQNARRTGDAQVVADLEDGIREVRQLYGQILDRKIARREADLDLVRTYAKVAPQQEKELIARFSAEDSGKLIAQRIAWAVEDEQERIALEKTKSKEFKQGHPTKPFRNDAYDDLVTIWQRLALCVEQFYAALPQRDLKTSLADPTLADFSLPSPLASQLFLEGLDHVATECCSVWDPRPRGFTVAAPVLPESTGSFLGIVHAPVVPRVPLSPLWETIVQVAHETGHWVYVLQALDDDLEAKVDLSTLRDGQLDALVECTAEVFPDFYAALLTFGPAGADRYADVLLKVLGGRPDAGAPSLPRLLRVFSLYLLIRRQRAAQGHGGAPGLPYLLTQTAGADVHGTLLGLVQEAASWLEGKAAALATDPDTAAFATELAHGLSGILGKWGNTQGLLHIQVRIAHFCLAWLLYPHLVVTARARDLAVRGLLRAKTDFGGVHAGELLPSPLRVAELSAYVASLRDSPPLSTQGLMANLLSLAAR